MGEAEMPTKDDSALRIKGVVHVELEKISDMVAALGAQLTKAEAARDTAYLERNALVAFLTHLYPSWLSLDPDEVDEWRYIVFVDTPAGQVSWHIHESELPMFQHLEEVPNRWDGHDTPEKYERIVNAGLLLERAKK